MVTKQAGTVYKIINNAIIKSKLYYSIKYTKLNY